MGLKEDAEETLQTAYVDAQRNPDSSCAHKEFIDFVIDNKHLTYKYVLFTEILSKAADESINTLCLQKKSKLPGAYDARTVCHKVIVPFEMEVLNKVLGGSNEPFLNKPARFPELSKTNAVRRGNDKKILYSLVDNLPKIKTSDDAYQCLVYLLCKLMKMRDAEAKSMNFALDDNTNLPAHLIRFIGKALEQSYEGEVLTLLVAGVYHLLYLNTPNAKVEVHPVNQSGASGREVSDLDIYISGKLISSNELKDKDYAETDVRHAADKVIKAGGNHMLFIAGPRAHQIGNFSQQIEQEYMDKNFLLKIVPARMFFYLMLTMRTVDTKEFIRFILQVAHDTKFKEEVIDYLYKLAEEEFGLKMV